MVEMPCNCNIFGRHRAREIADGVIHRRRRCQQPIAFEKHRHVNFLTFILIRIWVMLPFYIITHANRGHSSIEATFSASQQFAQASQRFLRASQVISRASQPFSLSSQLLPEQIPKNHTLIILGVHDFHGCFTKPIAYAGFRIPLHFAGIAKRNTWGTLYWSLFQSDAD